MGHLQWPFTRLDVGRSPSGRPRTVTWAALSGGDTAARAHSDGPGLARGVAGAIGVELQYFGLHPRRAVLTVPLMATRVSRSAFVVTARKQEVKR